MTLEGGEGVKKEGERKSEENDLAKSRDESSLKKRALWFFAAIIIGIALIGSVMLFSIDTPDLQEDLKTANVPNTENITLGYVEAYSNIQIAKMGFLMILLLTLGILGFVGINYLSHPTKWSEKMIDKGRTCEYITVILIIGAVLTLGLLRIFESETIGTIFGAIAGYVLGKSVAPKG